MQKNILFILLSLLLFSCGGKKQGEEEEPEEAKKVQTEPQTVEVRVIGLTDFNRQLFSNGILQPHVRLSCASAHQVCCAGLMLQTGKRYGQAA